jgi:DNA-binding CsgD family transcriptional regulator
MSVEYVSQLLDLVYEAAGFPELWPVALDKLAKMAGGAGTFLFTADPRTVRLTSSESLRQLSVDILEGGWHEKNARLERAIQRRHPGFVREIDLFTPEEMDQEPTFRDFLRPRGFGWVAGTLVQVPSDDTLVFSIERRLVDGPVEDSAISRLDALRPHLARAALMSARLGLERAKGMADSLAMMGLPSAVLLGDGRVIATNPLFEQLGNQIVSTAFGKLALTHAGANALLSEAIQNLNSPRSLTSSKSIAVPSKEDSAAMIVHLIPVRRSAHDIFGRAMGILVVTPLGGSQTLPHDLLNGLFDLSPSEIRAANGLLEGKTIDDLATQFALSRETIRSQVKAVFAKTGTTRQSELISLLANVRLPRWHQGPLRGETGQSVPSP